MVNMTGTYRSYVWSMLQATKDCADMEAEVVWGGGGEGISDRRRAGSGTRGGGG